MNRSAEPHIAYVEIGVYPAHVGVTTSRKAFARELKRLGHADKPFFGRPNAHATVHVLESDEGELVMIMTLAKREGRSIEQLCGLVAHEATHVVQELWDAIGEHTPGREAEAYLVQNIVQCCMEQVLRTGRSRRKHP